MQFSYCVKEQKPCVRWIEKYFKDCLCNLRDDFSFGFGLISLVCWGVAEIPQIITNFQAKSGHGVSVAFLLTWVVGDIFNLVGCLLEPATLPTQYYTALLYTTSTLVLVLQSVYYDYIRRCFKCRQINVNQPAEEEEKPILRPKRSDDPGIQIPRAKGSSPRREYHHYMSPRSLAGSGTPPFRSYLRAAKSGPSAMEVLQNDSSSEDEAAPIPSNKSVSRPRPIPRSAAGYGTFLAASVNLPLQTKGLTEAYVGLGTGRRNLLHGQAGGENVYGQSLGWLMAAIYMGGRLPQIWLNIKRGSVEGMNPLMFIFALVANATYVASILVRTTEWKKIKANMPWLLDAIVCVALDLFIILQYVYYKNFGKTRSSCINGSDNCGDYVEAAYASSTKAADP